MFNEHARGYGLQGASIIAIPRATGTSETPWFTAGAMAAVVSASHVISSNRVGSGPHRIEFGGAGFAFSPAGELIARTDRGNPLVVVDLDLGAASSAQPEAYPLYVAREVSNTRKRWLGMQSRPRQP
jgi:N-carbamoylputrescine amidase